MPLVSSILWLSIEAPNNELRMAVMDTLCSLVIQLGSDFAIFVPTINKVIVFICGLEIQLLTGSSAYYGIAYLTQI